MVNRFGPLPEGSGTQLLSGVAIGTDHVDGVREPDRQDEWRDDRGDDVEGLTHPAERTEGPHKRDDDRQQWEHDAHHAAKREYRHQGKHEQDRGEDAL